MVPEKIRLKCRNPECAREFSFKSPAKPGNYKVACPYCKTPNSFAVKAEPVPDPIGPQTVGPQTPETGASQASQAGGPAVPAGQPQASQAGGPAVPAGQPQASQAGSPAVPAGQPQPSQAGSPAVSAGQPQTSQAGGPPVSAGQPQQPRQAGSPAVPAGHPQQPQPSQAGSPAVPAGQSQPSQAGSPAVPAGQPQPSQAGGQAGSPAVPAGQPQTSQAGGPAVPAGQPQQPSQAGSPAVSAGQPQAPKLGLQEDGTYRLQCASCGQLLVVPKVKPGINRLTCPKCKNPNQFEIEPSEDDLLKCQCCGAPLTKPAADGLYSVECDQCQQPYNMIVQGGRVTKISARTKPGGTADRGSLTPMMLSTGGFFKKTTYILYKGTHYIGRWDENENSDFALKDNTVSRRSVRVDVNQSGNGLVYKMTILKATNPIYHNKKQLVEGDIVYLNYGDVLQMGNTTIKVQKQ